MLGGALAHEAERVSGATPERRTGAGSTRNRADVVLVAVRHEEAGDAVVVQGPELRVDDVDAEARGRRR